MAIIDIVIGVLVLIGFLSGLRSGLVRQLVGFVGLVAAIILGVRWGEGVGSAIANFIGVAEGHELVVGFIVVLIGVYLVAMLVSRLLRAMVKTFHLSGVNRFLGALFGGLKTVLILGAVFMGLAIWELPPQQMRADSMFYRPIVQLMTVTWEMVGDSFPDLFGDEPVSQPISSAE